MNFKSSLLLLLCLAFPQRGYSRPFQSSKSSPESDDSLLEALWLSARSSEVPPAGLYTAISLSPNNAVPALTFLTLSYLTYVATTLYFPAALTTVGIPVLEDFSRERNLRSSPSFSPDFLGSIATDFVTDVLSKTETVEGLRNTSGTVLDNSVKIVKRTSKFVEDQVSYVSERLETLSKALRPGCLSRYMCKVGQFTSLHLPPVSAMMRSVDFENLDDYGQAFIDGTTIGDCDSVFPDCDI